MATFIKPSDVPEATNRSEFKHLLGYDANDEWIKGSMNVITPMANGSVAGIVKEGEHVTFVNGVPVVTKANDTTLGLAKSGKDIKFNNGVPSIAKAGNGTPGLTQDGDDITYDANGKPVVKKASDNQLGLAKSGDKIKFNDGVPSIVNASIDDTGVVKVGDNIDIAEDGTISVKKASKTDFGVAKVGENIDVTDGEISVPLAGNETLGLIRGSDDIEIVNGVPKIIKESGLNVMVIHTTGLRSLVDGATNNWANSKSIPLSAPIPRNVDVIDFIDDYPDNISSIRVYRTGDKNVKFVSPVYIYYTGYKYTATVSVYNDSLSLGVSRVTIDNIDLIGYTNNGSITNLIASQSGEVTINSTSLNPSVSFYYGIYHIEIVDTPGSKDVYHFYAYKELDTETDENYYLCQVQADSKIHILKARYYMDQHGEGVRIVVSYLGSMSLGSADVPVATATTPGIIKPGTGLTVDEDGTLEVSNTGHVLKLSTSAKFKDLNFHIYSSIGVPVTSGTLTKELVNQYEAIELTDSDDSTIILRKDVNNLTETILGSTITDTHNRFSSLIETGCQSSVTRLLNGGSLIWCYMKPGVGSLTFNVSPIDIANHTVNMLASKSDMDNLINGVTNSLVVNQFKEDTGYGPNKLSLNTRLITVYTGDNWGENQPNYYFYKSEAYGVGAFKARYICHIYVGGTWHILNAQLEGTGADNQFITIVKNDLGGSELPVATSTVLGGIKVGNNLTIGEDGTLNGPAPYSLPTASSTILGGVKVGSGLTIDSDGVANIFDPYVNNLISKILSKIQISMKNVFFKDELVKYEPNYNYGPEEIADIQDHFEVINGLTIGATHVLPSGGILYPPATFSKATFSNIYKWVAGIRMGKTLGGFYFGLQNNNGSNIWEDIPEIQGLTGDISFLNGKKVYIALGLCELPFSVKSENGYVIFEANGGNSLKINPDATTSFNNYFGDNTDGKTLFADIITKLYKIIYGGTISIKVPLSWLENKLQQQVPSPDGHASTISIRYSNNSEFGYGVLGTNFSISDNEQLFINSNPTSFYNGITLIGPDELIPHKPEWNPDYFKNEKLSTAVSMNRGDIPGVLTVSNNAKLVKSDGSDITAEDKAIVDSFGGVVEVVPYRYDIIRSTTKGPYIGFGILFPNNKLAKSKIQSVETSMSEDVDYLIDLICGDSKGVITFSGNLPIDYNGNLNINAEFKFDAIKLLNSRGHDNINTNIWLNSGISAPNLSKGYDYTMSKIIAAGGPCINKYLSERFTRAIQDSIKSIPTE